MPETRYRERYDGQGNLIEAIPYVVSDEQLAEEAEGDQIKKVTQAIDGAFTVKQATILKRVFGRLIQKGLLP